MSAEPDFDLLRQGFVPEMRDLLEKAAAALLDLEADPGNAPAVNELFRVVHTIKGTAGMFELPLLVELVHAAEDLLGAVRDGKVTLSAWIADDMLGMFDQILLWVDEIDAHGCLPVGSGDFVRDRAARYRAYLAGQGPVAVVPPTAPAAPEAEPEAPPTARTVLPAWVDAALAAELAPKLSGAGLLIRHTPRDNCFFTGDDPLFTMGQVPGRLWARVLPAQPWAPSESFDPYACNLVFDLLSDAPRAEIETLLRYVLSDCEITDLAPGALSAGATPPAAEEVAPPVPDHPLLPTVRAVLATQSRLLAMGDALTSIEAVTETIRRCLSAIDRRAKEDVLREMLATCRRTQSSAAYDAWLAQHLPETPEPTRTAPGPAPCRLRSPQRPARPSRRSNAPSRATRKPLWTRGPSAHRTAAPTVRPTAPPTAP